MLRKENKLIIVHIFSLFTSKYGCLLVWSFWLKSKGLEDDFNYLQHIFGKIYRSVQIARKQRWLNFIVQK